MSRESTLWQYVKRGLERELGNKLHLQRHEDAGGARGIPDVSFALSRSFTENAQGWIELKVISAWPKRPTTVVRMPKFTALQRTWLMRRGSLAGSCFFLLRIEENRDHLLIPWTEVQLEDSHTQEQLISTGTLWNNRINFTELVNELLDG